MIRNLFVISLIFTIISCGDNAVQKSIKVSNTEALNKAIQNAVPGDEIILSNGVWKDAQIKFIGKGTKENPIILRAETAGKVFLEGKSDLKFGGEYLVVKGLYFRNGYTPSNAVIDFKINKDQIAYHCTVTNCVILGFNQPSRDRKDHWVEFWGRNNQLDHCYLAGKTNEGPTVRVEIKGNRNIKNYHQIVNNHFGPRPRKGGPKAETIQLGDSFSSMSPSNTLVANNLFEACNGEVEIISSKTNFNEFRNNVFYKSEGSLVTRHGNYCTIDGNYFIGDDNNENIGGIRIINTGHWVSNNYFYKLKGKDFRSPLSIMNGIPKSPLNRYNQVTDVVVAHNTWVDCISPWQFGVGSNISQKEVLPLSEIRSARPLRMLVANNIIYNEVGDPNPIIEHDKIDGVTFKNNLIHNQNVEFKAVTGLVAHSIDLNKISENIFVPTNISEDFMPYRGFEFETISKDLFGNSRKDKNSIGAIIQNSTIDPMILDKKKYGTDWYSNEERAYQAKTFVVNSEDGDLEAKIKEANNGDVIELNPGTYALSKSLVIDKKITIQAKDKSKTEIVYSGMDNTPAFELNPLGDLTLNDIILTGGQKQYAFASLKENMYDQYKLTVNGSEISNFYYVLKAYKETFAEEIAFANTLFKDCRNGIELSEETNDKGDYNVEFLLIDNCQFDGIDSNVIDYYRGGYDESTIGGNLLLTNSSFVNCGKKETNGILLNTRGIVNVDISNNIFKNNPVKLVALLWGAKNNRHADNLINNSGEIRVEQNLKQKLVY